MTAVILWIVGVVLGLTGEVVGSVVSTIVGIAYFTYLFGRGQTLGMMGMKIKLTRTDGTDSGYSKIRFHPLDAVETHDRYSVFPFDSKIQNAFASVFTRSSNCFHVSSRSPCIKSSFVWDGPDKRF
jgi:hypothetical protein